MKTPIRALAGGAFAIIAAASAARSQQAARVVDLPVAAAITAQTIGSVIGIRQLPDGRVLVDDGARRQLRVFDNALANSTLLLDSTSGNAHSYGARPSPLVPYLGDSTLFPDYAARALIVIDPTGHIARTLALPNSNDVGLVTRSSTVDSRGRLIYLGTRHSVIDRDRREEHFNDSLPILRADLDVRRTDTIATVGRPLARTAALSPDGRSTVSAYSIDPLRTIDEWAVLADGTVGIVRGHDYHVDWVRVDGTRAASPKMPFDWKRVDDADKQRIFDSTRTKLEQSLMDGSFVDQIEHISIVRSPGAAPPPTAPASGGRGASGVAGPGRMFQGFTLAPREVLPLDQMADYYPPIRSGAVTADLDGNLWVLPMTSAQSRHGELVYDVVNAKGELFERVRLPLGRTIVGFAKGSVVYTASGDRANGFHLERSVLPSPDGGLR